MGGENPYKLFAVYSSIIFILPAGLLGGYFLGNWGDDIFQSSPWLTYLGLLLGGIAGFRQMFQLLNRTARNSKSGTHEN
jgi:F0F1-type ATP synthase assembly protein I